MAAWLAEFKSSGVNHCVFITRNQLGSELVKSAISEGLVTAKKVSPETVVQSQKMNLHLKKRQISLIGLLALGYFAALNAGSVISIRLRLYSFLKVYLRSSRIAK